MKKKYLFLNIAKRWNNLLGKFTKLQKKIELHTHSPAQYNKLVNKLQQTFSKLEKMQYQSGIKLAGTSLAIVLSSLIANAQFAAGELLTQKETLSINNNAASTFADLDGDGDDDLYIGNNAGNIQVFLNEDGKYIPSGFLEHSVSVEPRVFRTEAISASSNAIYAGRNVTPVFVDLDGDSDLDLYVGNNNGTIEVYTNDDGGFTSAGSLQVDGSTLDVGSSSAPAFADIDNDGDLDLYIGYLNPDGDSEISLFTNSNGVFTAGDDLGLTGPPPNVSYGRYPTPAFNDADNDGDLDLYAGSSNGWITLWTNDEGTFTYKERIESNDLTISTDSYSNPTFHDVDNDGDLDLYVNGFNSLMYKYTNNDGIWDSTGVVHIQETIDVGHSATPTFADLDNDGVLDLYVGSFKGTIEVFNYDNGEFIADGDFQTSVDVESEEFTIDVGSYSLPVFADIDDDGDLDLYTGDYYGGIKFYNNDEGVFIEGNSLVGTSGNSWEDYHSAPAFADIDGDGDLDLYAGKYYGNVSVYTNNNGDFTQGDDLQADSVDIDASYRSRLTFADIDDDGDLDLYLGGVYGNIEVFTNTNGTFSETTKLQAEGIGIDVGFYSAPTFADVDGDGDLDLFVGNGDGNITFYENLATNSVGIDDDIQKSSLNIYPNPATSIINTEEGQLEVFDAIGNQVLSIESNGSVDVSGLESGIYFVTQNNKRTKLIIE